MEDHEAKWMMENSGRPRDETGHKSGLGTIVRSAVTHPIDTYKAGKAFHNAWKEMKEENFKNDNVHYHSRANYEVAVEQGNPKLAEAFSALREHYKAEYRPGGDTRTPAEVKATMDANKSGREGHIIPSINPKKQ